MFKEIIRLILTTWLLTGCAVTIMAQVPPNDDCDGAIDIDDPTDYCSEKAAFDLFEATEGTYDAPDCWDNVSHDLWFTFVARFTSATITVNGFSQGADGGTLREPEVALYSGECGGIISELECGRDDVRSNIVEITQDGLIIGERYLIRVDAAALRDGTFQLCVRNFNPPAFTSSDCPTAAILCDKSSFVVPNLSGGGMDDQELNDASCFSSGITGLGEEFNSVWFNWTCDQPGTLTFALTPLNPVDDLDFVLYELPNGVNSCTDKEILRCMAAGASKFEYPTPCHGPTGLNDTATDTNENAGCEEGQDNWLRALDMEAGKSYALVINNFTTSGNGIKIDFGGTGTFLGPDVGFVVDPPTQTCYGEPVSFQDVSSFSLGDIIDWQWNFGINATPQTADGPGPHQVEWSTPGTKTVALRIETDRGCVVTETAVYNVDPCCETLNEITADAVVSDVLCASSTDGAIDLTATSNSPITDYDWSNSETTEDINGLAPGSYMVTITNEATCEEVFTYSVDAPPPIQIVPLITMPTCMGGTDGAIELAVSGGTPPFRFDWGSGFQTDNQLANLSIGTYNVRVRDANDCEEVLDIEVNELELLLDSEVPTVVPPSCYDSFDGSITLNVANGLGPYQFDYNDGNGFVTTNTVTGLNAGTYTIDFVDANGCRGDTIVEVLPPDPIDAIIDPTDLSCNGADDGEAVAIVNGGVGGYQFVWSDPQAQTDSIATGLAPGVYSLTLADANGCDTILTTEILEPDAVFIDLMSVEDVICFGDQTGTITVAGSGGTPDFTYSLDGQIFQPQPVFGGLPAGDYTITVRDAMGCEATVDASITEPRQLIVEAGMDQTVELGYTADLRAIVLPPGTSVTYSWSPPEFILEGSCLDCPNPEVLPVNTTYFTVTVTDPNGCTAVDSVLVSVLKNRPIYIPNAFSPNGDGRNDKFTIFGGPGADNIQVLRVFNRWGALIYEGRDLDLNDEARGWDGMFKGEKLPPDVFAFYTIVDFIDGESVIFEGDITLVK